MRTSCSGGRARCPELVPTPRAGEGSTDSYEPTRDESAQSHQLSCTRGCRTAFPSRRWGPSSNATHSGDPQRHA
eukprot:1793424-Pyramimonas_sp.AAC.1